MRAFHPLRVGELVRFLSEQSPQNGELCTALNLHERSAMSTPDSIICPPTANQITDTRQTAGLTQAKSAHLVHVAIRTWKQYEAGDRTPHVALWELYLLKSGQHPTLAITEKQPIPKP